LRQCDFTGATLIQTQFTGADCTLSRFTGCDLTYADFSNATLNAADLSDTELTYTKLHNISEQDTVWRGANRHKATSTDAKKLKAEQFKPG
jgi:uncharacterized protein YjbI with pentapeptide repeats